MEDIKLNGNSMIPLSDLVRQYCLKQGNVKATAIARNILLARDGWKDLVQTTMKPVSHAVCQVDPNTGTIQLPLNCSKELVINLSVVDALGKTQVLTENGYFNTVDIRCLENSCSCNNCAGRDTLCATVDAITATTEEITIKDGTYTQTTWVMNDCEGNVKKAVKTPYWDVTTEAVVYDTKYSTICTVTVNESGCIERTAPNISTLQYHLGYAFSPAYWGFAPRALRELIPTSWNLYGEYAFNAADPTIVHIFRPQNRRPATQQAFDPIAGQIETLQNNINQVIVTFRDTGEQSGTEILVPEFAQISVEYYMMHQTALRSPRRRENDCELMLKSYRREKEKVVRLLNPINAADLAKIQTLPRKW